MPKNRKNPKEPLAPQSAAFLEILTDRGIVEDDKINDEKIRQADKEKKRRMFHNTQLLLQHYRKSSPIHRYYTDWTYRPCIIIG